MEEEFAQAASWFGGAERGSWNHVLHRGGVLGPAGENGRGKSTCYGLTRLLPPPGVITGGSVIYHRAVCRLLTSRG